MSKKLLLVLPHDNFRDKEYSWLAERLQAAEIEFKVVSSHLSEAKGRFGDIVKPDLLLKDASLESYDGVVFIGEETAREYVGVSDITKILDYAKAHHKLVAAIGEAVAVLLGNHIVSGVKLTGPAELSSKIEEAGAFYRGKLVETDYNLITANGPYAVREFTEAIVNWLQGEHKKEGRKFLR